MKRLKLNLLTLSIVSLIGCGGEGGGIEDDNQIRDYSEIFTPLPTTPVYPENNPYSEAKEQLGELLFWDPILSGDQNVACASCHHPDFGWADGSTLSIGSDGIGLGPTRYGVEVASRHTPTIMNVAFTGVSNNIPATFISGGYFWDLTADTLEEQLLGPITNPVEMLGYNVEEGDIMTEVITRLQSVPAYVELFEQAFTDSNTINAENIARALATFERKIISPNTRFDQFIGGDTAVYSEQELIGLNTFIDGGCSRCHSGPLLSDNLLHSDEPPIIGEEVVRTPSLRNLSYTAPYMHDGSRASLSDAINDYEDRGDIEVTVGEDDFNDLEAFLKTLDTGEFYRAKPDAVPSGLAVGGDIE
jgi:cytochrome c peroxidase